MGDRKHTDPQYLQVRRVIASIAYANSEFDESERHVLASGIADSYDFSEDDMRTLIEDAASLPATEVLASSITEPTYLRMLFVDLMTLAITKDNWEETELSAVYRTLEAAQWPKASIEKIHTAFELLRAASYYVVARN